MLVLCYNFMLIETVLAIPRCINEYKHYGQNKTYFIYVARIMITVYHKK